MSAQSKVTGKGTAQPGSAQDAASEDNAAARSGFQLQDETVEAALTSREYAGILEDYFGEAQYRELQKLAGRRAVQSIKSVDWADYVHYGSPDFVIKV